MVYIIGVGGVGSWLAEAMCKLVGKEKLTLVDGDTLEHKNLDRQLFTEENIGDNKADAMADRLGCSSIPRWYSPYEIEHMTGDWLMCCVDNNAGRKMVLLGCDKHGCSGIFAANEVHSSEAYTYLAAWKGTRLDPRTYYPEIETDESNNPEQQSIGCTGEAQKANVQLVTANFMASALAAHMYVVWAMESRKAKPETRAFLPHRLNQNLTRNSYVLRGEIEKQATLCT